MQTKTFKHDFWFYVFRNKLYGIKFYLQQNGAQEPLNLQDLRISEPLAAFIMPHAKRKLAGCGGSWSSQRAFVPTGP